MPSKRITVDTEVYQRLIAPEWVGLTPNQVLRKMMALPDVKAYRPRRKRNWLQRLIRKVLK